MVRKAHRRHAPKRERKKLKVGSKKHDKAHQKHEHTRHHMTPVSRGGSDKPSNLVWLGWNKHDLLHKLFGNKTLEQSIEVLIRVHRAKARCVPDYCPYCRLLK